MNEYLLFSLKNENYVSLSKVYNASLEAPPFRERKSLFGLYEKEKKTENISICKWK